MAPAKDTEAKSQQLSTEKEKEKKVTSSKSNKKDEPQEEELSEEDQQLKSELDMLTERLTESNESLYQPSLDHLKRFIRESTASMTAVPKPLKFLRPQYPTLIELHSKWTNQSLKTELSDILSVLGMTYSESDGEQYKRESLKYRLQSNIDPSIYEWGHEYLKHLSLEIGEEYQENLESGLSKEDTNTDQLVKLSLQIVPYFLKHNAEAEAVDLLLEIEEIQKLPQFVDKNTFNRVCLYMVSCVPLLAPPDDLAFLNTAFSIYLANDQLPQALSLAINLDDESLIKSVFDATDDVLVHKQLGFILGRQNSCFKVDDESIQDCISNLKLSEYYRYLVGELNLLQPKVPEDVYKSHLETSSFGSSSKLESAKQNLAAAFVNSFLNAGYGNEKLIEDEKWLFRTKGEGMLSTTASLGLINLWESADGLQNLDKYLYSEQDEIKAGALLGMGISTTSVHDEVEPTLLLLQDYIHSDVQYDEKLITSAITGIGIAFAGSENEEVLNLLLPLISEPTVSLEIQALSALALGHVYVGTCNGDITSTILQTLLEKEFNDLTSKWIRFISLGLGLLYMGKYDQVDDVLETIDAIDHPISKTLKVLVNICSYAGTGNVLQIQSLLQMCTIKPKDNKDDDDDDDDEAEVKPETKTESATANATSDTSDASAPATGATGATEEKKEDNEEDKEQSKDDEEEKEDETYQGYAVLGLALIAMGEEIGQEMSLRHFDHLMHYGTPLIKRAVPLAMGLVSASSAQMKVYETLSRYSHDQDLDVAYNAIFGMGLVGAGTNNARLAQLLRQLASYYTNDQNGLFISRISQGLTHLGKGTLTLNPFSIDKMILSKVSLAALLTVSIAFLDPTSFILDQNSNLMYYLTPAIKPRMLVTVDEDLKPVKVNVRVGTAVDVVGQAGKPKTITGWVTHSTPVLLGYGERAELENDEYIPLASSLEGIVILKKNPDFYEEDA